MNPADDRIERRFRFEECTFKREHAHGGAREISFSRVVSRERGPLHFVDLTVLDPGADVGTHTHALDNEELYIVVSGRGLMLLDGREFEVGPGHVILNRPGGTHGLRNIGDEPLRIVVVEVAATPESGGAR